MSNTININDELKNLSEEERELALNILKEYSQTGESQKFTDLLYSDYKEIPVDIETFLKDDNYLGKAWKDATGKMKLYPYWLEEVLKKIFPNNLDTDYDTLLESGARGIGKAQPLDSPVLSEQGFIRMGDVKVGTKVYGRDGKLHNVIAVFPQGLKPVYKIKFSDNTETLCSDEHLWKVYKINGHNSSEVLTLNQIMERGLTTNVDKNGKFGYKFKIPMCEPISFESKKMFISPYILGCLIGDGGTNYSNEYLEEIERLGLKCRAENKFIPCDYLLNDVESRIALLQGLMDTDGYCAKNGYCTFSTSSEQLKDDFIFLVESLGGTAPYRIRNQRGYKNTNGEYVECLPSYEITVNLPSNIIPFRLSRKAGRILKTKKQPVRTIHKVEYIGEQECQCILLDSDEHLYITDDFIVTHNSEVACGCVGAYLMYRVMCLKNPLDFYHLKPTEKICFAFMNIKLDLSEAIATDKFQKTIQMSPWFSSRCKLTQRNNQPYLVPPEPIEIIIGSQADDVIGRPIYFAFFDEISFIKNQDIDKQKQKAKDMIDTAIGGMMTRFVHNGKNPTMLVVASSKRSEQSFMEEYIKLLSQNEGNKVLVVDKPVWEVKPKGTYGEGTFYLGLGNKFLESLVIPDSDIDKLDLYREKGYKILEVPLFFRAKFLEDMERTLCDIAGISSSTLSKYMSAQAVNDCINTSYQNPLPDIIECGNGKDDTAQYYNYFDMSKVPAELKSKPLFIHLDMSISGDMTGIAGVWITGKKTSSDSSNQSKDLQFRLAFSTSIKAPKGRQISFEKNRNFIRWLRESGFSIKKVSSDTFQAYDLQQQLKAEGFDCEILSVDRVNSDHICVPYQYLKSTIYEKRFEMYKSNRLFDEFIDVERNINTGKVDHTPNGHKDALDAVCGSVFEASKFAEEYAFDYGESLDFITTANSNVEPTQQQIIVDFEEEMKRAMDPLAGVGKPTEPNRTSSQPNIPQVMNGMLLW